MWDDADKNGFFQNIGMNCGQINNDQLSYYIRNFCSDAENKSFLEIGTWNGLGSTKQFVDELVKRNDDFAFYSLECNTEKSDIARNFYKDKKNIFILNEVIFKNKPKNFYDIFPECKSNDMYDNWNKIDIENCKNCKIFLERWNLPFIFDVILLDGGEFTTYFEYQFLKNRCKYLLLDDINTNKCKLIVEEIEKNKDTWEVIIKNTSCRNGFLVCKKKDKLYKDQDYITCDKFLNFSNTFEAEKVKYYKHDFLFNNGIWRDKFVESCINNKSEIVIVGHSDFSMTDEIAVKIKKETNCKNIFCINNESSFPWVISLPLGLTNNTMESLIHPIYGNTKILLDIQLYNPPLINKLYINFSINTNIGKRQPIYDYLSKQPFVTVGKTENTLLGRENFLRDIKKHIFVACPEGNGLDTHRLWETLYCGGIPIVLKNRIHSLWIENKNIPICWVDNWFDITEEFLDKEFAKLKDKIKTYHHELTFEYWVNKIKNIEPLHHTEDIISTERNQKNVKVLKLFNLDLHISVISDITDICKKIFGDSIQITNWSISGHNWVFNRENKNVKHVNQYTWRDINSQMIKNFVNEYREMLETYDGFIVTHTPVFALLYASFNKPIIIINSCRYEQPFCFNKNFELWSYLNNTLIKLQNEKLLYIISNNLADKEHLKNNGIDSVHIPSLCEYINVEKTKDNKKGLVYSNENIINNFEKFNNLVKKSQLGNGYKFEDLYKYSFFVHLPYEVSTMSIFEQYSSGTPLLFPTKRFLLELTNNKEYNFNGPYIKDDIKEKGLNCETDLKWWIEKADYYDDNNFKYCYYFDNLDELFETIYTFKDIYEKERNLYLTERRNIIYDSWRNIFKKAFNF